MERTRRHLLIDILLISISIIITIVLIKTGLIHQFIERFGEFEYFGIFISGMFFTSVFTTTPSIVLLSDFAIETNIIIVAIFGGMGAVFGDYLIFRFIKDRVSRDINYIVGVSGKKRLPHIFKTKLFHWFLPFLGAIIIASPIPDEIGITMLGLSKVNTKVFLLISFLFNSFGILIIGLVVKLT
ncbi:MAG: hypothetical protein WDK96_01895 [Candidatus Paceibacterota bacterium]|jgi:hypothetical protein